MPKTYTVAVIVGSLRADSLNRKLATVVTGLAPENLAFQTIEIGDLPLYNADLEEVLPEPWARLRSDIAAVDAVLFVTPEYNRSVPAALKNALDVGSRPIGSSAWNGKPCAIITGTPGAMGGFGANHHLRQSLVFLNMPAMQQPEAYIGGLGGILDDDGAITRDDTRDFLGKFMSSFATWIATHR